MVHCWKRQCFKCSRSLLEESALANCHFSKAKFVDFVCHWLVGVSSTATCILLGMSPKTVTDLANFLCELVDSDLLMNNECQIGGPGIIVETDELKFGKHKHHASASHCCHQQFCLSPISHSFKSPQRGKKVEGCWAFDSVAMLKPGTENPFQEEIFHSKKCWMGNLFAVVVEKQDARTLMSILRRFAHPGSLIMSDLSKAHTRIEEIHEDIFLLSASNSESLEMLQGSNDWHSHQHL